MSISAVGVMNTDESLFLSNDLLFVTRQTFAAKVLAQNAVPLCWLHDDFHDELMISENECLIATACDGQCLSKIKSSKPSKIVSSEAERAGVPRDCRQAENEGRLTC